MLHDNSLFKRLQLLNSLNSFLELTKCFIRHLLSCKCFLSSKTRHISSTRFRDDRLNLTLSVYLNFSLCTLRWLQELRQLRLYFLFGVFFTCGGLRLGGCSRLARGNSRLVSSHSFVVLRGLVAGHVNALCLLRSRSRLAPARDRLSVCSGFFLTLFR